MKLSERTITALTDIVTGDNDIAPYRSGPELVRLFNDYGANDSYSSGFPSRRSYANERIAQLNGTQNLRRLILHAVDPREYIDNDRDREAVSHHLNRYLKYEGFELVKNGELYKIRNLRGSEIELTPPSDNTGDPDHAFIEEQIRKCDSKIDEEDYDGAITNARSLIEAVLISIERKLSPTIPKKYDGDLVALYRRVQKFLNLAPSRVDVNQTLKQILSSLNGIVCGLSSLRNVMSDSHARSYKPRRHHAKLAVNASKTLVDFVFETMEYQVKKGSIKLPASLS